MTRIILTSILLIVSLGSLGFQVPEGAIPDWNEYHGVDQVPGITLRWRVYPKYVRANEHFFQFNFINATDTARSFDYFLMTETDEVKVGNMSLKPGANRLSGWYFEGRTITRFGLPPADMIDAIVARDRAK